MANIFDKDGLERRVGEAIATAKGCTSKPKDPRGSWPDGWIVCPGAAPIPLEVVQAFPQQASGERNHTNGEAWPRDYASALDEQQRRYTATGRYPTIGTAAGKVTVRDDNEPSPITEPIDPVAGVRVAIKNKSMAKYGPREARRTILGVHHVQGECLTTDELKSLADYAREIGAPFREIWVVSEYPSPAQQVV